MKKIIIYGIFSLRKNKLIKVDLSRKNIENEFDLSMYSDKEYSICKLEVTL
jgi:hypothetical protein